MGGPAAASRFRFATLRCRRPVLLGQHVAERSSHGSDNRVKQTEANRPPKRAANQEVAVNGRDLLAERDALIAETS